MVYTKHNTPKDFMKRGITLLATGYALNFFREGVLMIAASLLGIETTFAKPVIYSIGTVDILQFAGMGFLTIGLLKKLSFKPLHMLGITFLLQCFCSLFVDKLTNLSPPINCFVGLFLYTGEYSAFPLFLWLPYLVIGVCFGTKLMQTKNKKTFYFRLAIGSSLTYLLLSIGYHLCGIDTWRFYTGFENLYYKQNPLSTLWIVSIVGIALSSCYGISLKTSGKLEYLIKWISSNLNTIYIIHWLVISYSIAVLELLDFDRLPQVYIIPTGIMVTIIAMVINQAYKQLNQEVKLCRKKQNKKH